MLKYWILASCAVLLAGCQPEEVNSAGYAQGQSNPEAKTISTTPAEEPKAEEPAAPAAEQSYAIPYPDRKPKDGEEVGVFETDKGRIVFMFFPDKAPNHVAQVKKLIGKGFYDGTRFHRCIDGFMVQGGDPNSRDLGKSSMWGSGGYVENGKEVTVKAEFTDIQHKRGVLSAARSQSIDSASSQFFIMHKDTKSLDGQYSAWGQVLSGMDAVDKIVVTGDAANNGAVKPEDAVVLKSAKLAKWPVK